MAEAHGGAHKRAKDDLQDAVQKFPGTEEPHLMLGWFLATCPDAAFRSGPRALAEAMRGAEFSPDEPHTLDVLAAAYAEAGNFEQARQSELQALSMSPYDTGRRQGMEARLNTYRADKPHRDFD